MSTAVLVNDNAWPIASSKYGSAVVYNSRLDSGLWNAYLATGDEPWKLNGSPILPLDPLGHRGCADISNNARYVLFTEAVGADKLWDWAAPGQGSSNALRVFDRQTEVVSELFSPLKMVRGVKPRGILWPRFDPSDPTRMVWSEMVKSKYEFGPYGRWKLHITTLAFDDTVTVVDDIAWENPDGGGIIEPYSFKPDTNDIYYQTDVDSLASGYLKGAIFAIDSSFTSPPRHISSPQRNGKYVHHEWVNWRADAPDWTYGSIVDTQDGCGMELWRWKEYDPTQREQITFFSGQRPWCAQATGYPRPSYRNVVNCVPMQDGWLASVCKDMMCKRISCYRVFEV
jgi:hypothetical protein